MSKEIKTRIEKNIAGTLGEYDFCDGNLIHYKNLENGYEEWWTYDEKGYLENHKNTTGIDMNKSELWRG